MDRSFSGLRTTHVKNLRQAYVLLILGVVTLLAAWLIHPDIANYPIGPLALGIGFCIAATFNPYRLAVVSWFALFLGIYVFLEFKRNFVHFNGGEAFSALIIALGLGLLGIVVMARRGYVGIGAIAPAIIVLGVGILEYLLAANLAPANTLSFILSLWFAAYGLLLFGIFYLLTSRRV
ncbi:MAG TPA: hypothetical protein VKR42_03390 [Ktedonobacteraceae bacterium]|nr:hypothetical protein [Ktedonobacteraceae bacterium]